MEKAPDIRVLINDDYAPDAISVLEELSKISGSEPIPTVFEDSDTPRVTDMRKATVEWIKARVTIRSLNGFILHGQHNLDPLHMAKTVHAIASSPTMEHVTCRNIDSYQSILHRDLEPLFDAATLTASTSCDHSSVQESIMQIQMASPFTDSAVYLKSVGSVSRSSLVEGSDILGAVMGDSRPHVMITRVERSTTPPHLHVTMDAIRSVYAYQRPDPMTIMEGIARHPVLNRLGRPAS